MLTHRNLLAMTMNFYADMCPGFGPDDVALHAAPLSHGSGCYALPNIGKAAANVILESKTFDPELVFKTIEQYRVTNMFAAPTMINVMIDSSAVDKYDHGSLKALNYGGGAHAGGGLESGHDQIGPLLGSVIRTGGIPHDHHVFGAQGSCAGRNP